MAISSKKLNKILLATDFSRASDVALSKAIELAKINNAELTILHVVEKKNIDEELDWFLGKILPKGLWLTTEEYYLNLLQMKIYSLDNQKLNINKKLISKGKPAEKILQYAKREKFDLLVIGAHGHYSIRDSFVGTTAEYIAERTKCPLLIIKRQSNKAYRNILVPIDFSKASKNALKYAIALFPDSNIDLLHVGDYEYEELLKKGESQGNVSKPQMQKLKKAILLYLDKQMKTFIKFIRKKHQKISYFIDVGYPGPIIIKEAEKKNRDLIIMGTQGHGKLHYLSMGRVANRVLKETNKDIFLIPPN